MRDVVVTSKYDPTSINFRFDSHSTAVRPR